jgi:tetratricopeptide (TPR) repeat protein
MKDRKHSVNSTGSKYQPVFKFITILIPIVILLTIEGFLRLVGYGDNLNLFVKNPVEGYEKYMMVNPIVGKKYFQKFEYTAPANDIFLKEKPDDSFRIFVMGSSTVFGFPYERNLMFSRILDKQLSDVYPDKKIEVVNTSITAINSYTLLDYVDEILDYQPDAILIYAGHNEFYGAFGVGSNETMSKYLGITRLHIALMDYRLYQLMRNGMASVAQVFAGNNTVHGTLMKRMVANKDILLNSPEYKLAMQRYEQNMGDLLKKTQKANIPVFLSDLVCNVKGLPPFNSVASDTLEAAMDVFHRAQKAEQNGDYETARELYYQAKDLDCVRFRASEDVNVIINRLSQEYKTYKVNMLSHFQDNCLNGLIGNELMTEHVHPTIQGAFLMSEAFLSEIKKSELLGEPDDFKNTSIDYYKRNWGYTELDSLLGHHRVQNLKGFWPFVKDVKDELNYRQTYQPKSKLDKLAFNAMKNPEVSLSDVRLDIAREYEKSGEFYKAYKEYESLVCTNPYIAINYRDAANNLLQLSDLPNALAHFQKSLEYESSFYAYYRSAEIYLIMGDYNRAIDQFKQSYPLAPEDNRLNVLGKSYQACVYAGNTKGAEVIANEIKKLKAYQLLNVPTKSYVYTNYIPYQTRQQVLKAQQLMGEQKLEEALVLLESSLQIYDSHIANRLIGEIYLAKNDLEKAHHYFTKTYNQFKFDPQFLHEFVGYHLSKNDKVIAKKYVEEIKLIAPKYKSLDSLSLLVQ